MGSAGTLTPHHSCDLGLVVSSMDKDTVIEAAKQLPKGDQKEAACLKESMQALCATIFSLVIIAPGQGQRLIRCLQANAKEHAWPGTG